MRLPLPFFPAATLALLALAACSKPIDCPLCYQDEWSREPFPGEAKQHIQPLTPAELKANGGVPPMELVDHVSASTPDAERF